MTHILLFVSLICVIAGLFLLRHARARRRETGLPRGAIRYTDTGDERPHVLFSPRHGLSGRPDYLVEKGEYLIPIEVKSTRTPAGPYRSHMLQLAAYCLLVEETHGRRPPYGIIRYADTSFHVDNTAELRDEVINTLDEMRDLLGKSVAPAIISDPRRCRRCGYQEDCNHYPENTNMA